jgi:hypothetical protein
MDDMSEPHCPLKEAPHVRATFIGKGQPIHPATHMQFVLPSIEIEFWGHGEHEDEPNTDLKVFSEHGVHGPPSGPVKPVMHLQALIEVLTATEVELPGHVSQAAGPGISLNVFAGQAKQGAPSAPVYPALHWHVVAPAALCELTGHARQIPPAGVVSESILYSDKEAREKL